MIQLDVARSHIDELRRVADRHNRSHRRPLSRPISRVAARRRPSGR